MAAVMIGIATMTGVEVVTGMTMTAVADATGIMATIGAMAAVTAGAKVAGSTATIPIVAIAGMAIITATRDAVAALRSRVQRGETGQREEGDRRHCGSGAGLDQIYHDAQRGGGRAQDPS